MGCCLSTPKNHTQTTHKNHHHEPPPPQQQSPPLPPSPPFEEEYVKEVLSETPIPKPPQGSILTPETKTLLPLLQNPLPIFETKLPIEEHSEPVSQLSETCSMSESFSATTTTTATATTTTVNEVREEDEATSKVHKWDRSPSRKRPHAPDGNFASGRDRRLKSPARKSEPSPEKKIKGGPRQIRGREMREPVMAANRRRNSRAAAIRRDSGEGSGRRSRSPARAMTGKMNAGGSRKEVAPPSLAEKKETAPEIAVGKENEKEKKSEGEEVGEENDVVLQEECLENPHVSMECFIFL
ncbi:hypothetical protein LR48_Vigan08g110400 [Vigna angularis]|uniref:Uncharacterized protein n=1 Tax=Phaseolus angularis TaxID=3914 RepID=A0A0L9V5P3_PHAAN|nr:uncharacterized protein LOC108339976 [Vigna angularis]KAG2397232.1 uncharacterized protein HKW66_Vig0145320 [Vigna angularis]KOM50277.1 hypothetical protein LR48_Vigan08g110400 [Vigna angularis]